MAGLLREHSREYKDINSLYFVFPDKKMAVTSEEFPVNKQGISGEHIEELEKIQELDSFPVLVESPIHEGGSFLSVIQKVEDDNGEILGYVAPVKQIAFLSLTNSFMIAVFPTRRRPYMTANSNFPLLFFTFWHGYLLY